MICSPPDMLTKSEYFRRCGSIPPSRKYKREWRVPPCSFAPLVWKHFIEFFPLPRLWTDSIIALRFVNYVLEGDHLSSFTPND